MVQLLSGPSRPFDRLMFDPEALTSPEQVLEMLAGEATCTPVGSVLVNARLSAGWSVVVMVKLRVLMLPGPIVLGVNACEKEGRLVSARTLSEQHKAATPANVLDRRFKAMACPLVYSCSCEALCGAYTTKVRTPQGTKYGLPLKGEGLPCNQGVAVVGKLSPKPLRLSAPLMFRLLPRGSIGYLSVPKWGGINPRHSRLMPQIRPPRVTSLSS